MKDTLIRWQDEDGLNWQAQLDIVDFKPAEISLAYEKNGELITLAKC